jgi:hypothetical protein
MFFVCGASVSSAPELPDTGNLAITLHSPMQARHPRHREGAVSDGAGIENAAHRILSDARRESVAPVIPRRACAARLAALE